jgi:signal transduction histidine kinase
VLRRIVQNLLGNAIRYTPSGRVLLGVRRRNDALEIQVWDTGPGILPEQLSRLQQAFEQGEQRDQQGVGLGLYIVTSLCQQLGYQLKVRTTLRRGSCFSIVIPRVAS